MTKKDKARVLELSSAGKTTQEIANILFFNMASVETVIRDEAIELKISDTPKKEIVPLALPADGAIMTRADQDLAQKRIAGRCLKAADALIQSIENLSVDQMAKMAPTQRAISAGILIDKARLLNEQSTENISMKVFSWAQMVSDSMPSRPKDAAPVVETTATPAPPDGD